jgi:raffinose/stachyose/melibiose transport system substrate-binding protein
MFPPARRKRLAAAAAVASLIGVTAACSSDDDGSTELTVLTWRTDLLEDGTLDEYAERFTEANPGITVEFEGITDYEGEVRTRMNTDDYGDVLGIVGSVTPQQLPDFFEPLGSLDELSETYRFLNDKSYEGMAYGIPVNGNTNGFVYNKRVWEEAGVTDLPTTPEEFLDDLQAIEDTTDAIPLYTNYAAGWTVTQWEAHRGEISADPDYVNSLVETDAPWTEGSDHHVIDSLLWDVVEQGLTEEDPTTTDWEASKGMLGRGEVATMVLGSWAISQMQDAADDPADIGYMPFPYQVDGRWHASVGGDFNQAINVNSEHKEEARAWIDWFNAESGYAESQGGLSPLIDGPTPDTLADFEALGDDLVYIEQNPAPTERQGLLEEIDKAAEIGLGQDIYRKRIIDAARGQGGETKEEVFEDLNTRWAEARASVDG